MREVNIVNRISNINPFPTIFPARSRSPCPRAIAANGEPPAPTIAEKEEIKITMEVVTPIPAKALFKWFQPDIDTIYDIVK